MYTEFYNLQEKPFDLTHSARFLYLGEVHKEALAMLTYGVMERKSFVLLTGEVGTGKTTILRTMLSQTDRSVKYVHLANPLLSAKEFINYLTLSAFRNRITFKSKAEFLLTFEAFLTKCSQQQRHFLLVIDEAHKLSYDLLEEIRLLSNMETADEKLISIFLVGQPELNQKLNDPRCRALLQRISIRYHMKPINLQETQEYLAKRLNVAGAQEADDVFPSAVQRAIYEFSGGFPRMINILSDNLLLLGYARGQRKLTPGMVRECFEDLKLDNSLPVRVPEPETKNVVKESESSPSNAHNGFWKWALIGLLLIVVAAGAYHYREEIRTRVMNLVSRDSKHEKSVPAGEQSRAGVEESVAAPAPTGQQEEKSPGIAKTMIPPPGEAEKKTEESGLVRSESSGMAPSQPSAEISDVHALNLSPWSKEGSGDFRAAGETVVVQHGDTLDKLAKRIYGRSDEKIWEMIQKSNPDILDVDFIRPGQTLLFPPLPESQE
jgi:type II secretory pathway predicted ATPase ExeA/phage tail protein X